MTKNTEQEKTSYVQRLLGVKESAKQLEPHELRALEALKAAGAEVAQAEKRLMALQAEIERSEVAVVTARGKANALADLLWNEHVELRGVKADKAPAKPNGEAAPTA
jgi:phage gp16-like protein